MKNFRKSLMQIRKNKLNDRPRIKTSWAQQEKCLQELAGSAENFPKHPLIFLNKGFLHSLLQPLVKREKIILDLKGQWRYLPLLQKP